MTIHRTFSCAAIAPPLLGLALLLAVPCRAESADDDAAFAALQADAKKSFDKGVTPFVKDYCVMCHGNPRSKGAINFLNLAREFLMRNGDSILPTASKDSVQSDAK